MQRFLVAALALTFTFGSARAQTTQTPPSTAKSPSTASTLDPKIREEIDREVAKAKAALEDQLRAEAQTAQAAVQYVGPQEDEKPRLQFFEVHGYFRMRGDLLDHMDLNRDADPLGYYLYPRPIVDTENRGTITSGNLRLRLEPTLNVSEYVRVKMQTDVLDNLVLGSGSYYQNSNTRALTVLNESQSDSSSSIAVKRAYAEVQTPIGLLTFGRMPSHWGLGILSNAGGGLDSDYGDTVDRIQFAVDVPNTPVGTLTITPMITWISSGVLSQSASTASVGQPFDRDQSDDARSLGFRIERTDSPERLANKLQAGLSSFNYGLWYSYRSQTYDLMYDYSAGTEDTESDTAGTIRRDAYAHVVDAWMRYQTRRFRLELEMAGIYGQIGNASSSSSDTIGPVLLRQFGGAIQSNYQVILDKLSLGGEVGFASGDTNAGMGNHPERINTNNASSVIDAAQYYKTDKVLDIRNFNFNRAYRVDMILWREVLDGVTDAFYVRPNAHWNIIGGLAADAAIIYSQAIYASSTPSGNHKPLGIEFDVGLSYNEDHFGAFLNYGMLQPLSGFDDNDAGAASISRAHALRSGLVIKF